MPERLVVVGGNAAGMSAASEARRRRSAADLSITVFEASRHASYSSCGEPYYVGGMVETIDELYARSPAEFAAREIDLHLETPVQAIDPRNHTVFVVSGGSVRPVEYDTLLIATGSRPADAPFPGAEATGVFRLHTLDDAMALRSALRGRDGRVVIVGGGYIGLEVADVLLELGRRATIVCKNETVLLPQLDVAMARLVERHVQERGVAVETSLEVDGLDVRDGRVVAVRAGDRALEADIVLLALGVRPAVDLATAAGLPAGESGGIVVDAHQRTAIPDVWAAGDCCETFHRVSGRSVNYQLGTIANKQGRIAGINIGGGDVRFPGVLGTTITKVGDLDVGRTGLTADQAGEFGFDVAISSFRSAAAADYWPERRPMTVQAVIDRSTRRVLGAQVVGASGTGKRIDAFALAIWNEMTVDSLVNVDLSYAPPFGGVWDPVLVAARQGIDALSRS